MSQEGCWHLVTWIPGVPTACGGLPGSKLCANSVIHAEHLLPSGNLGACRQGCLRDRPTKYPGVGSGELLDRLHFTCYHSFVGVSPGRGSARGGGLVGGISLGSKLGPGLLTLPPDPPKVAAAECGFGLLLWCCLGACCSLSSVPEGILGCVPAEGLPDLASAFKAGPGTCLMGCGLGVFPCAAVLNPCSAC